MWRAGLKRFDLERVAYDPLGYRIPSQLMATGYLSEMGWYRSVHENQAVDVDGNPIPWLTYPAIALLAARCKTGDLKVFEYGAGASTAWWAARAVSVVAVEHDPEWAQAARRLLPGAARAEVRFVPLTPSEEYERAVIDSADQYDVIVIDGRRREQCAKYAASALSERGVIVWDNSDRERYAAGIARLERARFRRLDLWGMAPIDPIVSCTGIFYRPGNVLGL